MPTKKPFKVFMLCIINLVFNWGSAIDHRKNEIFPSFYTKYHNGHVSPDFMEYYTVAVSQEVARIYIKFHTSKPSKNSTPGILIRYGALPTKEKFDQIIGGENSHDFYHFERIHNLKIGTYFVGVWGGSLFGSIINFLAAHSDLFYHLTFEYYECPSGLIPADHKCYKPVKIQYTTPVGSSMNATNNGCLDSSQKWEIYSLQVNNEVEEFFLRISSRKGSAMKLSAYNDIAPVFNASRKISSGTSPGSLFINVAINNFLRIKNPRVGTWFILVENANHPIHSCNNSTGATFELDTFLKKCTTNYCTAAAVKLNQVLVPNPLGRGIVYSDYSSSEPSKQRRLKLNVLFIADISNEHVGLSFLLSVATSLNIKHMEVYIRINGLPTQEKYDMKLSANNSSSRIEIAVNQFGKKFYFRSFRWKAIEYTRVGRWFILLHLGKVTASNVWTLNINLKSVSCPPNFCNSHGQCTLYRSLEGISFGGCKCQFGWGDRHCTTRMFSRKNIFSQTLAILGSNAAILPAVIASMKRKNFPEALLLFLNGVVSFLYHACDMEIFCSFGYFFLQRMDFAFSFNSILIVTIYLSGASSSSKATLHLVFFIEVLVVCYHESTSILHWIIIGVTAGIQFLTWIVFIHIQKAWRRQDTVNSRLEIVVSFLFKSGNFNFYYFNLGIISWTIALVCWFSETSTNYWRIHSCWHISAMLAAFFLIISKRMPNYKILIGSDEIDLLDDISFENHLPHAEVECTDFSESPHENFSAQDPEFKLPVACSEIEKV